MITKYAVFDIETIPCQSLPQPCRPVFDEASVKLGNLKDRVKIEEKIGEARAAFEANVEKKMSFDPDLLQIVCFAGCKMPEKTFFVKFARNEDEEYDMLHEAWDFIGKAYSDGIPLIGFNSEGFDFPALIRRSMLQNVSFSPDTVTNLMRRQDTGNPGNFGNPHHIDLMKRLAFRDPFTGKPEVRSLDWHLKRFGLDGKPEGMNGAMVYRAWKEGRYHDIIEYCREDTWRIVSLFERVAPWIVLPKQDRQSRRRVVDRMPEVEETAGVE